MTPELKQILDSFKATIENWNNKVVTNEEEFRTNLKKLNDRLTEELAKPQPEQKTL